MEASPGRRAVPMDHQDCQLHQAGVHEQQDELSRGNESLMRQIMNDDRSRFAWRLWSRKTIRKGRQTSEVYSPEQHQQILNHFSRLDHTQ
eukprot:4367378-Heterocapsa_arctica.AAC.1